MEITKASRKINNLEARNSQDIFFCYKKVPDM